VKIRMYGTENVVLFYESNPVGNDFDITPLPGAQGARTITDTVPCRPSLQSRVIGCHELSVLSRITSITTRRTA
jgi:hypothetical protein